MSDILYIIILLTFFVFGFSRPHVALLGLVWVNTFKPMEQSFGVIASLPISLYGFLFFIFSCAFNFKAIKVPRSWVYHFIYISLMVLITLANQNAEFPLYASFKYENVIKTLIFGYFIPFVIYDRKKLEDFLWIVSISLGTIAMFGGIKSLLGGGGYGVNLIGIKITLFSEGSIYTNQMLATIPINAYLAKYSLNAQKNKFFKYLTYTYIVCSIATLIGTQARSGLVCLILLVIFMFFTTKHKLKLLGIAACIPILLIPIAPDEWFERMSTLENREVISGESSAMGRVVTWRWAIHYLQEKPLLGGGFFSYLANEGQLNDFIKPGETRVSEFATAYHNILFEVAANNGIPALIIFLLILLYIFWFGRKISKHNHIDENEWKKHIARNTWISMLVYCAGGMFVAYAFYPWLYYLFAIIVILNTQIDNKQKSAINETR